MRSRSLHALIAAPLAGLALAAPAQVAGDPTTTAIGFICSAERHAPIPAGQRRLEIEPGLGAGGFPVRTTSREAQAWFNYGVVLFHAFYHDDAKRAFDKAVALDPDCGLCLWGQALSHGPTLNFDLDPGELKTALDLAKAAQAAARTPLEKALSDAIVARYSGKQDAKAETDFAAALIQASRLAPADVDLRLIAAHAVLTAERRGDKSAAASAIAILEPILQRAPDNTGAIHYYIHATEQAGRPQLALPYAERLARLAPKASHLVHMAAHAYIHAGRYEDAAVINARALAVDADHADDTRFPGPLGMTDYYPHNLSFGLEGALMAGDGALALKFADDAPKASPGETPRWSVTVARSYVAYGRYNPERALALAEPSKTDVFRQMMWRYARGEALARKGDARAVREESRQMADAPNLTGILSAVAQIGRQVLDGRAAMLEGKPEAAAKIFQAAAAFQERFHWGMDPPPWWYPVRRSLAAALLKSGDAAGAAREARASLALWPRDGLALWVLSQAESKLGDAAAARAHLKDAREAWRGDLSRMTLDLV